MPYTPYPALCRTVLLLAGMLLPVQEPLLAESPEYEVPGEEPALAAAIRAGDERRFAELMSAGAALTGRSIEGYPLVEHAARMGRAKMLARLLEAGAEGNASLAASLPLAFFMAALASDECFRAYATHSRLVDRRILPALATRVGSIGKIEAVVTDPNIEDPQGNIPIHEAARRGDMAVFRRMLEMGGNLKAVNSRGETTLMHAAYGGNADLVALVLDGLKAKDCSRCDKRGATAGHYAQRSANAAAVRRIIAQKEKAGK